MKIIEVVVSYSQKVNTGNYQSQDYFTSLKAEIEYDANLSKVAMELFDQAKALVDQAIVEDK